MLSRQRSGGRLVRTGERGTEGVSNGLEDMAACRFNGVRDQAVVPCKGEPHRLGMLLPEAGRALDVGKRKVTVPVGRLTMRFKDEREYRVSSDSRAARRDRLPLGCLHGDLHRLFQRHRSALLPGCVEGGIVRRHRPGRRQRFNIPGTLAGCGAWSRSGELMPALNRATGGVPAVATA